MKCGGGFCKKLEWGHRSKSDKVVGAGAFPIFCKVSFAHKTALNVQTGELGSSFLETLLWPAQI